jgi:DNA-directed RNA polymerase subunit delta
MNRVITSFKKANRDLLKYIMEEYPDGVDEETLVSFPKAGGGSIRALEIEMGDTIYLVKMEDEEYYQKYMAKDDDDEDDETATVDVEEDIEEVEVDEEIEVEDEADETDKSSDNEDDEDED